jgi:hypothetical protein
MTNEELDKFNKHIAKLKMAGFSLDIDMNTPDGIPLLNNVNYLGTNDINNYTIDFSSLNNGKIRFAGMWIFTKYNVDFNSIDYSIQDPSILRYLFQFKMYHNKQSKELNFSQEKLLEIESFLKREYYPPLIAVTKPIDEDTCKRIPLLISILKDWINSKALLYAILNVDRKTQVIGDTSIIGLGGVSSLGTFISIANDYGIKHADTMKDRTRADLKEAKRLASESLRYLYDSIGNMYDIFEPKLVEVISSYNGEVSVHPVLKEQYKDLLDKCDKCASEAISLSSGLSFVDSSSLFDL